CQKFPPERRNADLVWLVGQPGHRTTTRMQIENRQPHRREVQSKRMRPAGSVRKGTLLHSRGRRRRTITRQLREFRSSPSETDRLSGIPSKRRGFAPRDPEAWGTSSQESWCRALTCSPCVANDKDQQRRPPARASTVANQFGGRRLPHPLVSPAKLWFLVSPGSAHPDLSPCAGLRPAIASSPGRALRSVQLSPQVSRQEWRKRARALALYRQLPLRCAKKD